MAMREDLRQSSLGIRRLKSRLHDSARRADEISRERGDFQMRLQQLETTHPEWVQDNFRDSTGYFFFLAGITAVYFLDLLLFGPTAEILSEMAFHGYPLMTWVARALVPAAILLFEIAVALQIYFTRRDSETYHSSSRAHRGWIAAGIILVFVMPCLVVGTSLVQSSFADESVQTGLRWQRIGLVLLALVMHIGISFSGRLAHEAKAFFAFKAKHRSLRRKIGHNNNDYDREIRNFREEFDSFYELLNRHRQTYLDSYDPGPFDAVTRGFARTIYGYEVIQNTPGTGDNAAGITSEPQSVHSGQSHQVLDQVQRTGDGDGSDAAARKREEESEVRA
jgi:hypothetical protein